MFTYVNHQAMHDLFRPLEVEPNPIQRVSQIDTLYSEIAAKLEAQVSRTAYELKTRENWSTGQISEAMNISERMVKRFITDYAADNGKHNPLKRRQPAGQVIDITRLVNRRAAAHQQSADTTHPIDG